MSTDPLRVPRRLPVRMTDTELLAALRAGDPAAFPELCARHEPALRRFARSILRARPAVVDDVVQESLLRAHRALRRDDRHIEVRPYLFRLVRNCCLDEIARSRTDSVALHLLHPGDEPASTDSVHSVFERRNRLTTTLADVADLPESQRHALLRREIDGLTHEQVAAELGVTPGASRSLVLRARETLTRAAAARGADCEDVRADLLRAHDARRRASVSALRHVASCSRCRAFRTALKHDRRSLRVLAPPAFLLGSALFGGKAIGLVTGASKPAGVKAAAVLTAAALAAGGAYELHTQVFGPGARAPISVVGVALPGRPAERRPTAARAHRARHHAGQAAAVRPGGARDAHVPAGHARRRAGPRGGGRALARFRRRHDHRRQLHRGRAVRQHRARRGQDGRGRDPLPPAGPDGLGARRTGHAPRRAPRPRLPAPRRPQPVGARRRERHRDLAPAAGRAGQPPRMAARTDRRRAHGVGPRARDLLRPRRHDEDQGHHRDPRLARGGLCAA